MTIKRPCKSIAAVALAIALLPISAQAAEWRIEPLLRIAADFDDNPNLTTRTDLEESVSGYIGEASAKFAYSSDRSNFFVLPKIRTRNYGSDSEFDSDDVFLLAEYLYNSAKTRFRLRADYSNEATRTAERSNVDLGETDPDFIPDNDSGFVALRGDREVITISPTYSYNFTNVSSVALRATYVDVGYEDVFMDLLTDYTDLRLSAAYRREMSPRNTGILALTARKFETDDGTETDGYGFLLGIERDLTETTRFRAVAGLEDTDLALGGSTQNWVADVSLARQLETTTLLAQYRRRITPSGSGALAVRDSVNLNFVRRLSDRVSAGIGARIYATNDVEDAIVTIDDRDYVQLKGQFTWSITEHFSFEADYRYTFLNRESLGESANSNEITLWLNWIPTPIVRSR